MNRTKVCLYDLHWLCTRYVPRLTALIEVFGSDFLILISGCNNQDCSETADWWIQLFFIMVFVTKISCQTLAYGNNLLCFRGHAKWLLSCPKWTAEDFPWHWRMSWVGVKCCVPTSSGLPDIAGCSEASCCGDLLCQGLQVQCTQHQGQWKQYYIICLLSKLWRWGAEFP